MYEGRSARAHRQAQTGPSSDRSSARPSRPKGKLMPNVTTGLTNGGVTTHFNFSYDSSLGGAGGVEPARINQLLATGTGGKPVIENDFDWLQAQFAGVDMTKSKSFPIPVQVTAVVPPGGGYSASWGWPLLMNARKNASTLLRSMFIA